MRTHIWCLAFLFTLCRLGSAQDEEVKDLIRSADDGHLESQVMLGLIHFHGTGVPQNNELALKWFSLAAEQHGDPKAQSYLGFLYSDGKGMPEDDETEAIKWYERAADQGLAAAQNDLGAMYDNARAWPWEVWKDGRLSEDDEQARELYEKAELQGNANAQCNLGVLYEDGIGLKKDEKKARELYEKAAIQGNADAQFRLGAMWAQGRGGKEDETKMTEWYRLAADQGHADAQCNLGIFHASKGDFEEALRWCLLAVTPRKDGGRHATPGERKSASLAHVHGIAHAPHVLLFVVCSLLQLDLEPSLQLFHPQPVRPWWFLAFKEGRWKAAHYMLENSRNQGKRASPILLDYIEREWEDPLLPPSGSPETSQHVSNRMRLQSALNWADWYLRVATHAAFDIQPEELAAMKDYIMMACPEPTKPFWEGFASAADDLLNTLQGGEKDPLAALLKDNRNIRWVRLAKGDPIPRALKGCIGEGPTQCPRAGPKTQGRGTHTHIYVAPKGKYTVVSSVDLEADAELWIERGSTIVIDGRKIPHDYALRLRGHLRVYGEGDDRVEIVIKHNNPDKTGFALLLASKSFQYFTDLEIDMAADEGEYTAIQTDGAGGIWMQHCTIDGSGVQHKHTGMRMGRGFQHSSSYLFDSELKSLSSAIVLKSTATLGRNTFSENGNTLWPGWYLGDMYVLENEFVANTYDLFSHEGERGTTGYGGDVWVYNCNLTSNLSLHTGEHPQYHFGANFWKTGKERQIDGWATGRGSEANFVDCPQVKKKIPDIGYHKRPRWR